MKLIFFITLINFFICADSLREGRFLFSAPKRFLAGSEENVCVSFKENHGPIDLNVIILEDKKDVEITSAFQKITQDEDAKCFNISMPRTKLQKGRLQLVIHFKTEEDYKVNYIKHIFIQSNPDVTFIQTDKPVYNGGQIVKFRIFTIRPDFSLVSNPVDEIHVENPNGIYLAQWFNVSSGDGFISKSFQLTSDPLPGKWIIKAKGDEIVSKSFLVEDYVLPRFYLSLTAPESVDFPFNVNVSACARYNFGQPVKGNVVLHFKVKCPFTYYCRNRGNSMKRRFQLDSDGCAIHQVQLSNITSLSQRLVINATVEEDGTGAKAFSLVDVKINPYSKFSTPDFSIFVRKRQFKPGLPLKGKILTKGLQDNTSLPMSLCLTLNEIQSCQDVIIASPETEFVIFPTIIKNPGNFISNIELKHAGNSSIAARLGLIPWYSPSESYLLIENGAKEFFQCNTSQKLKAVYSISNSSTVMRFHYMIKSRGDILSEGVFVVDEEKNKNYTASDGQIISVNYFKFDIKIDANMSPISYLLLYHIRQDGEIIADTTAIPIQKCFKNQVELSWENDVGEPGSKNLLKLHSSSPDSVCALNVFDESVKLISKSANVDEDSVFKAIEKFEIQPQFSEICTDRYRTRMNHQHPQGDLEPLYDAANGISRFVDSLQAFDDFGVTVITDLTLETRPCMDSVNIAGELMNNLTSRHSVVDVNEDNDLKNEGDLDENTLTNPPNSLAAHDLLKRPFAQEVRSFFPETWIWDIIHVNDSGMSELEVTTPDTLTTWNADAICLSKNNGLGISKTSQFRSFKPFFLDFALPRTLKRKEILHLQVTLFNYLDEDLPIRITCLPGENLISKSEEIFKACVAPNSKIVHIFPLEAVKLGESEIKIKAEVEFSPLEHCDDFLIKSQSFLTTKKFISDSVLKKTVITHEGFPVEHTKSGFICGENDHFESSISWNIKIPADVVESSIFISASVSGDILGPALQNANNLITLPTGCGEQNMILLVPNLLLLEYFFLAKPKEVGLIENALKNLDLGYQRQLKYKRPDGSYSAFGENDEKGSIWLTAFVVRYLSQAQKFIHIDKSDLKQSVKWIIKQQLENGCFPVIGKFYHQDIKKEVLEEDSSKTLTAYILISLIESGMTPKTSTVIKNSIYCLKGTDESLGLYGDLMTSYALLLAGETRDAQTMIIDLLKEAKRSYRMLWWENDENSSIESNIEMTSYGILSLVKLGGTYFLAAASDAVRWITQYRNQNGGFLSTQDTIVALEAIAKFSAILPKASEQDYLSIEMKADDNLNIFNITNENRLLQQSLALPSLVSNVTFNANGKGCALVQTLMRYNTRKGAQSEKFKINLKIDSVSEVDQQTIKRFHVCVRYKGAKDKINMAVLEVFMVSGFYSDRSSLYDINISHRGVRMWEEFEDKINFYFEDLKSRKTCVQFLVRQETCVENASPALMKIYDYYNTQYQSTIRYNLQSSCNQSQSWLDYSAELKSESKRELKLEDYTFPPENFQEAPENHFQDFDFDLETPQGGDGIMPVFALPPPSDSKQQNCPLCLTMVPDLFPKMYCSSQAAVRVLIRGKDIFDFRLDLTPRRNITVLRRTVSFTMKKECECPVLNSVNSFALLLVTPPRTVQVNVLQEMHLDSLTQLYSLEKGDELPQFVTDAINYCNNWKFNE